MSELARLRDQIERAYRGNAWHGPSLCELLEGVEASRAFARPVAGVHSIAELVRHIAAWETEAVSRLEGRFRELPPEEDFPSAEDPGAWDELVAELSRAHKRLLEAVSGLDDRALQRPVTNSEFDVYQLLHGVVQHNLYHAGQIAILKKA